MPYARVFQSGNSQAVRLPKQFRVNVGQVEIFRQGDDIVLRQTPPTAAVVFDLLTELPQDFMVDGRSNTPPQEREAL
ncbi:antitoxin [Diaphorobacter sp.]|uniref:antitoxin n=1 Tax=Diaphorobacter sp. TaxID=1934310 RepID=UPI003D129D43